MVLPTAAYGAPYGIEFFRELVMEIICNQASFVEGNRLPTMSSPQNHFFPMNLKHRSPLRLVGGQLSLESTNYATFVDLPM